MRSIIRFLVGCILLCCANNAFAADGFYLGATVGQSIQPKKTYVERTGSLFTFNDSTSFGGYMGYHFGWLKAELDISYTKHGAVSLADPTGTVVLPLSGDMKRISYMLNLLATGELNGWEFYGGVGGGISNIRWKTATPFAGGPGGIQWVRMTTNKNLFSYQFIAGTNYSINESVSVGVRYKYINGKDYSVIATLDGVGPTGPAGLFHFPAAHVVTGNIEYKFN